MAKLKLPFELEKPSANEYVTQASQIGYGGIPTACGLIYDISIAHAVSNVPTQYASLSAALGTNGANIPQDIRMGGMAVKFINSASGKYEQWVLKASSFSVNVNDWVSITDPKSEVFNYTEDANYKEVKIDGTGHILSGLDGSNVNHEYLKHRFHDEVTFDKRIISPTISDINESISDMEEELDSIEGYKVMDSSEYVSIVTDSAGRIVEAIKKDGTKVFFSEIEGKTIERLNSNINNLSDTVNSISGFQVSESPEYVSVVTDSTGKILEATKADGTKVVFTSIGGKTFDAIAAQILELQSQGNSQFRDKVIAFYGDSITAEYTYEGNDQVYPFGGITLRGWEGWQSMVAKYYHFAAMHIRGFGSQGYNWNTGRGVSGGGNMAFARADGSTYLYASDVGGVVVTLDNYRELGVQVPEGTTPFRGAFCSWNRITTQFPASIKDNIDIIIIMGGTNDASIASWETEASFVNNDTTDPEWAASSYYATYGGDYNITTSRGGMASTIMKFQAWMPNATIVIATPLSGRGTNGQMNKWLKENEYYTSKAIRDVASSLSLPLIDINAHCGINGLNRLGYIYVDNHGSITADGVHPFNPNGQKALAQAMIGGLKSINLIKG